MKCFYSFIAACLLCLPIAQAEANYDAIVLESATNVMCADKQKVTISEKRVITILNEKGKDQAKFSVSCSKWENLTNFTGLVTDEQGKVIRKIKKNELQRNEFAVDLASDIFNLEFDYTPPRYPVTVTYEWTTETRNGIIFFPPFAPQTDYRTLVEHATYSLSVPRDMGCHYKAVNTNAMVARQETDNGEIVFSAEMNNVPPVEALPYVLPVVERVPVIYFAPDRFSFMGSQGSLTSWNELGDWLNTLMADRGQLPNDFKAKIHALTDTCKTDKSKLNVLYRLLKEHTRYVSIQLGIGGLQPFSASEVAEKGFGDCKGLSNFMRAMLNEVGIESNYTIISTNRQKLLEDFVSTGLCNHAILQVPMKGDTVWIECTNPALPLGYVHSSIAGHNAIVVTPRGGEFTTLPQYADSVNLQRSLINITLNSDNLAEISLKQSSTAHQYRNKEALIFATEKQKNDWLLSELAIPQSRIKSLAITDCSEPFVKAQIDIDAVVTSPKFAKVSGSRIFVPTSLFHNAFTPVTTKANRTDSVFISAGYQDEEIININIPEEYVIEALPGEVSVDQPFASFSFSIKRIGSQVTIHTKLLMKRGVYPAECYSKLCEFQKKVKSAYRNSLVLVKSS